MKKLLLLSMVLVLCLATVGVGYAKWQGNLKVDGQVQTGVLAVEWWKVITLVVDPCDDAELVQSEIVGDTVKIKVKGAYPGMKLIINLMARNAGTLPAHVMCPEICYDVTELNVTKAAFCRLILPKANEPEIEPFCEENPLKIYPKPRWKPWQPNAVNLLLKVEVKQTAPMGECLEFRVKLPYEQVCPPKSC